MQTNSAKHPTIYDRALAAAALVAVTAVMGACTRQLDMEAAKTAIKTGLTQQLSLPIASVTCPETRDIKAGDIFECKATAETGGVLNIKVTQKDDAGNINWELTNGDTILSLTTLEKIITGNLKEKLDVDAVVDCGGKVRVSVPGNTFECTAKVETTTRQVLVTMKDDKGNVDWALK